MRVGRQFVVLDEPVEIVPQPGGGAEVIGIQRCEHLAHVRLGVEQGVRQGRPAYLAVGVRLGRSAGFKEPSCQVRVTGHACRVQRRPTISVGSRRVRTRLQYQVDGGMLARRSGIQWDRNVPRGRPAGVIQQCPPIGVDGGDDFR